MKILVCEHVAHEGLGTFGEVCARQGIEVDVYNFLKKPESPDLNQYDALIVMGGPMSANDNLAGLNLEEKIIGFMLAQNKAVLGICLGAQLIAKKLGARVMRNPVKEIGWYPLHITLQAGDDPLLGFLKKEETVFQWHGETFDLPRGAIHLASSPLCTHQAFRYKNNVYALQFHFEVTQEIISQWLAEPGNSEELKSLNGLIDANKICLDTVKYNSRLKDLSKTFFEGFLRLVIAQ